MSTIKKGTYRFNDVLTIPSGLSGELVIPINYTTRDLVTYGEGGELSLVPTDTVSEFNTINISLYDGVFRVTELYAVDGGVYRSSPCYESGDSKWNLAANMYESYGHKNSHLAKGLGQIINVLEDTVIDDEYVADWFNENTKTRMFTKLNVGETVYSSGGKCFKRLSTFVPFTVTADNRGMIGYTDSTTDLIIPATFQDQEGTNYKVVKIGDEAFKDCTSLTSIVIGDSVTSIWNRAFYNCTSLTSVVIGDSVTSIGWYAFYNCASLKSVYITDIEAWCNISFDNPNSNPMCYVADLYLNGELITELTIPDTVTKIKDYAFYNCTSLTSIEIPDSVTSIGDDAFYYCTSLTNIEIPDSVTSIGFAAFADCYSLTNIEIPDSVTSIGEHAFADCYSLTSVVIGDSVTSIGEKAFKDCTSLTSIEIPDSVTSIGDDAFSNCTSLTSIEIPDSVTSIGKEAFEYCYSLTSIVIPASVTSIGVWAFYNCTSLTSIKYRGTQSQWNSISKGSYWDSGTGNYTITYNYTGD